MLRFSNKAQPGAGQHKVANNIIRFYEKLRREEPNTQLSPLRNHLTPTISTGMKHTAFLTIHKIERNRPKAEGLVKET
jgi:hypothetical protein